MAGRVCGAADWRSPAAQWSVGGTLPDAPAQTAASWVRNNEVVPAHVLYCLESPAPHVRPSGASWHRRLLFSDTYCPHCGRLVKGKDASYFFLVVGFLGQGLFGLRFFVQWLASERARAVVIPESFWWLSIGGGVLTLVYAASILAWPILVGLGLNFVIYGRNLYFFRKTPRSAA